MTYLLALDASSTAVGWAVFRDDEYEESGVFIPEGKDWLNRIRSIYFWLGGMTYRTEYDIIAYETASGDNHNMRTNRILGAVEWACWSVARYWEKRWLPVNVQQVKASGCSKNAIVNAEAIAGHKMDAKHPGDEADAIGVGLAALRLLKLESFEKENPE